MGDTGTGFLSPASATMTEPGDFNPTIADDHPAVHVAPCPSCGGLVEAEDAFCHGCGARLDGAGLVAASAVESAAPPKHLRCENCGAEVALDPEQRSYACAFCDSKYVVELPEEVSRRQPPEFVIGFAVTAEAARERFREWIGSNSLFRPGDLKYVSLVEKVRGVYLPFWSFSMRARSQWSAQIGEYWYRTETYTTRQGGKTVTKTRRVRETEWWPLAGRHHRYYNGYLISASRGLSQGEAEAIKPFHLAALRRYAPHYLAGWAAEDYRLESDEALKLCQEEFCRREQQHVAAFLPGDTYRALSLRTFFEDVGSDLILLPVYVLTYRYHDKLYRFLVNGQTGRVAGSKPLSRARIAAAVAAGVALVAALLGALALLSAVAR